MNYSDLIGPAARVGKILQRITPRLKSASQRDAAATEKPAFLFYGPPGVGKTSLARILARDLSETPFNTTEVSGVNVNVELVRRWQASIGLSTLFGDFQVRMIEELDRVPRDAQDLLLNYLDNLPNGQSGRVAFIGTSNLRIDLLAERFQTRLRTWKILGPATHELIPFLMRVGGVDSATASAIAFGCGGNVRAALLDCQNARDAMLVAA